MLDWKCIYFMYFHRIATICKDYCGVLNEESIRCNFTLIYEILDEVLVSISIHVIYHILLDFIKLYSHSTLWRG